MDLQINQRVIAANADFVAILACLDCGFYSTEGAGYFGWIATRLQFPDCKSVEPAFEAFEKCGIPRDALQLQIVEDCLICDEDEDYENDY